MSRPVSMDVHHANFGKSSAQEPFLITDDIYPGVTLDVIRPQFYSISICISGFYSVRIYDKEYKFEQGQVMFFRPNEMHQMLEIQDFRGYLISFSPEFFTLKPSISLNLPFFSEEANSIMPISGEQEKMILNYFRALHKKDKSLDTPHKMEIVRGLLHALLFELNAIYGNSHPSQPLPDSLSRREKLYYDFTRLVNLHFSSEHSVKFYADQLHITPGYLGELVKEKCGQSPLNLIHQKITLEAKSLLKNTDETVEQVAHILNFPDVASFSRFFKTKTGNSPGEYRGA
jgi:AraC family transcriptional regulator, transcriptional activator of pobA